MRRGVAGMGRPGPAAGRKVRGGSGRPGRGRGLRGLGLCGLGAVAGACPALRGGSSPSPGTSAEATAVARQVGGGSQGPWFLREMLVLP